MCRARPERALEATTESRARPLQFANQEKPEPELRTSLFPINFLSFVADKPLSLLSVSVVNTCANCVAVG